MGPYNENEFALPSGQVADGGQNAFDSVAAQASVSSGFNIGGVIPSVLSFVDGIINRSFNRKEAQKARDWQEQMYNEYQSPEALLRQYEDAGLNPYLLYGNGSAAGNMPTASIGAHSSHQVDYNQLAVTNANARLIGAQATNQETENKYKELMILRELGEMSSHEVLNYAMAQNKDAETGILLKELAHWEESFTNVQNKILADIKELDNIENYRQAQIGLERSAQALERWKVKEETRIALIKDRTQRELAMNQLNEQHRQFIGELRQADEHFKESMIQEDKNRKQRYLQIAVDGVNDFLRTVGTYVTFGISGIGSNNSRTVVNSTQPKQNPYQKNDDGSYTWTSKQTGKKYKLNPDDVPEFYR